MKNSLDVVAVEVEHERRVVAAAVLGPDAGRTVVGAAVRDRYVFSILQNGWPISFTWARKAQDRFATVLASTP